MRHALILLLTLLVRLLRAACKSRDELVLENLALRQGYGQKGLAVQGAAEEQEEPTRITGSTPYEFAARGLTPCGGLLPLVRLLERIDLGQLIEERLTVKRQTVAMGARDFVLAMVLALYIGFDRLSHMVSLARDAVITGILGGQGSAGAEYLLALFELAGTAQRAAVGADPRGAAGAGMAGEADAPAHDHDRH